MLKQEVILREDGVELIRTFSDENKKIRQVETDIIYEEAIDTKENNYTYVETDEYIQDIPMEEISAESAEYPSENLI